MMLRNYNDIIVPNGPMVSTVVYYPKRPKLKSMVNISYIV